MVEFEIPDKWISNILKVGGALIVLVMVATLIQPSITGNVVSRVNTLTSELNVCSAKLNETKGLLDSAEEAVFMLTGDISELNSQFYSCSYNLNVTKSSLDNKTSKIESLEQNLTRMDQKLKILSEEYNRSSSDYLSLARYAAEKWCCVKQFLDNPSIASFDIDRGENEILCRESSSGEYDLEC
ncbi:MAG: hypothetical protein ACOCUR_02640 [Nanoarchaeota archaeon]